MAAVGGGPMRICACTHHEGTHAEDGAGYCFAGGCICEAFREDIQASKAALKAAEDEIERESNGYQDPKGESA